MSATAAVSRPSLTCADCSIPFGQHCTASKLCGDRWVNSAAVLAQHRQDRRTSSGGRAGERAGPAANFRSQASDSLEPLTPTAKETDRIRTRIPDSAQPSATFSFTSKSCSSDLLSSDPIDCSDLLRSDFDAAAIASPIS